jgi:two-component system cell cycle sensor histidine kinase/response regulator CckA
MVGEDAKLPEGYAELESLLKQVRKEAAYYRKIAQEVGKRHLRETEQLSRVIIELKQAGTALRKSEERFRETADLLPSMICEIDTNRLLTYMNRAGFEILGYSQEELDAGMDEANLFHPDDREKWVRRAEQIFQGKRLEATEYRILTKDGSEIATLVNSAPMYKNGKAVGIRSNLVDMTKTKQLHAQLEQAQKMEAIGTLAGGIAHDFNNLLMGIQGNVSLMFFNMDSSHEYYERLKNIEKQVQSGARLTSHLLGYARKGRYEVKPIDLNQLVEETSDTFGRTRKQIAIHQEVADDLFAIEADPGQIEQVLLNLFVNASDAMPGSGDLFLKTMNATHRDMTGKLYKPKRGDYVVLTVTDTGMGMDKETMGRIFDPFFTTKEMGRGTGLGLASAYGIIKAHGGYIDVESVKEQGTTFTIYLPASEKEVQKTIEAADKTIKGTGTALLVDDEEVILEVSRDLLVTVGYRVLTAGDGKEAIEVYRKRQDQIDIIILDMVMPNMGGGEAYDRIKEINPDVKVLLSSGYSIDGEATEILERGCNGFIQKPFRMNELAEKIGEILEKK